MFTGIVCGVGQVRKLAYGKLVLEVPRDILTQLAVGKSIAVNGVCLTVHALTDVGFTAGISGETGARTTLGKILPGARVNLELPLRLTAGLDGHIVLGHIDATGRVQKIVRAEGGWRFTFGYPPEYARYIVEKGSIAIDGISLTTFSVGTSRFQCAVIEETYERTNLKDRHPGDAVNLEFDILAKYVEGMMRNVH